MPNIFSRNPLSFYFFKSFFIFIILTGTFVQTNNAIAQTIRTNPALCPTVIGILNNLYNITPREYKIKQLHGGPGSEPLLPGDKYTIRYRVRAKTITFQYCSSVNKTIWGIFAAPKSHTSKLREGTQLGFYTSQEHSLSVDVLKDVTFTVPDPSIYIENSRKKFVTIKMGVCPDFRLFACATHELKIKTGTKNGWNISYLSTSVRAIGSGSNRVPANQPFELRSQITNHTGRVVQSGPNKIAQLRQVFGPLANPDAGQVVNIGPLPEFGIAEKQYIKFQATARPPGLYGYRACLVGVKDANNWPLPEICGESTFVRVGSPVAASWLVGGVQINSSDGLSSTTPAYEPFFAQAVIQNTSSNNNPGTGLFVVILIRGAGRSDVPARLTTDLDAVDADQVVPRLLKSNPRAPGEYEFKACVGDNPNAPQPDMACGPWSPITIVAPRSLPTPQPVAPVAPVANSCTGGQSLNAAGQCVCSTGKKWNAKARRCVRPSVRVTCRPPSIRNPRTNTCICRRGFIKIGNRCRRKSANNNSETTRPVGNTSTNRRRISCIGGSIKRNRCRCRSGSRPRRIGKYAYRCK